MTGTSGEVRLGKTQRQHRVARLIGAQPVATQEQLVALLAEEGVRATQTTVSRDLEELGALKVRVPGGETIYALPETPFAAVGHEEQLRRVLGEWVVEVANSGNLVVLRTPPGCAHVVGSAIDRSGIDGAIGTVAGDDTVLVVAAEGTAGRTLGARLAQLASLEAVPGSSADTSGPPRAATVPAAPERGSGRAAPASGRRAGLPGTR